MPIGGDGAAIAVEMDLVKLCRCPLRNRASRTGQSIQRRVMEYIDHAICGEADIAFRAITAASAAAKASRLFSVRPAIPPCSRDAHSPAR